MLSGCFLALRLCHAGLLMRLLGVRLRMGRMLICLDCVAPPVVFGGLTMGLRRGFVILSGSYMIFVGHAHLLSARVECHAGVARGHDDKSAPSPQWMPFEEIG
jgi:hypothetical protein